MSKKLSGFLLNFYFYNSSLNKVKFTYDVVFFQTKDIFYSNYLQRKIDGNIFNHLNIPDKRFSLKLKIRVNVLGGNVADERQCPRLYSLQVCGNV